MYKYKLYTNIEYEIQVSVKSFERNHRRIRVFVYVNVIKNVVERDSNAIH
jgi:hypothetical protein